jgi:hypothetical protein
MLDQPYDNIRAVESMKGGDKFSRPSQDQGSSSEYFDPSECQN